MCPLGAPKAFKSIQSLRVACDSAPSHVVIKWAGIIQTTFLPTGPHLAKLGNQLATVPSRDTPPVI